MADKSTKTCTEFLNNDIEQNAFSVLQNVHSVGKLVIPIFVVNL